MARRRDGFPESCEYNTVSLIRINDAVKGKKSTAIKYQGFVHLDEQGNVIEEPIKVTIINPLNVMTKTQQVVSKPPTIGIRGIGLAFRSLILLLLKP